MYRLHMYNTFRYSCWLSLTTQAREQEQLLQKEKDWQIQEVFTVFVNRQYDSPDKITLHDLCTWTLWPCYFKFSSELNELRELICFVCLVGKIYLSMVCGKLWLLMKTAVLDKQSGFGSHGCV